MAQCRDDIDLALEANALHGRGEAAAEEHLHGAAAAGGQLLRHEDGALASPVELVAYAISGDRPALLGRRRGRCALPSAAARLQRARELRKQRVVGVEPLHGVRALRADHEVRGHALVDDHRLLVPRDGRKLELLPQEPSAAERREVGLRRVVQGLVAVVERHGAVQLPSAAEGREPVDSQSPGASSY